MCQGRTEYVLSRTTLGLSIQVILREISQQNERLLVLLMHATDMVSGVVMKCT
jgi:hypothetical protein